MAEMVISTCDCSCGKQGCFSLDPVAAVLAEWAVKFPNLKPIVKERSIASVEEDRTPTPKDLVELAHEIAETSEREPRYSVHHDGSSLTDAEYQERSLEWALTSPKMHSTWREHELDQLYREVVLKSDEQYPIDRLLIFEAARRLQRPFYSTLKRANDLRKHGRS